MRKVGWQSISPIFADVMISPWNLLVGGLLIKFLPTIQALLSVIIGYVILSSLFVFYGGLGFKKKEQSSEIINEIFGSKITKYLVPAILAIGQIGWASINIELGGNSLAKIFSLPTFSGLVLYLYALHLIILGALDLFRMGIVKLLITISSVFLLGYVFILKITHVWLIDFISYKPIDYRSLLWGVSIVVASLISFSTVTPDFFQNVKSKKDIVISTLLGLFIPGVLTASLGCFLFFDTGNFDLIALISVLTFPIFPHILNVCTNTDGSIAIYTPGLKLQNMFGINLKVGIIISGLISFSLAMLHASSYLETWLKILSLLFPTLIGLVLAKFVLQKQADIDEFKKIALLIYFVSTAISIGLTKLFPPVLISLVLPLLLYKCFRYLKSIT
ncbi:MAG: hypothetical protein WC596_04750 [Candidatus Shapirobacteria bacterium]